MLHKEQRYEEGNVIDEIGSVLVMILVFALILVFAAYGKVTMQHLAVNNVAKEYLYRMEENGCLTSDEVTSLKADMKSTGVTNTEDTDFLSNASDVETQVTYGAKVTLSLKVKIPNPLYTTFGNKDNLLYKSVMGFPQTFSYPIVMSSTSKW